MNSLNDYLKDVKERISRLGSNFTKSLHFVVGNEAADLDSIICSLVYGYYIQGKNLDNKKDEVVAPYIWIPKEDLVLRNEVIVLLKKCEIDTENLLFLEDFPKNILKDNEAKIQVTLVDHNHESAHTFLSKYVANIIDHHDESHNHPEATKNIELVGSCSTLISEIIYYDKRDFLTPTISLILVVPLLIDTMNLDLHSGQTTEKDVFFGSVLLNNIDDDQDILYQEVLDAKQDITILSNDDLLRKDYKSILSKNKINIGIPSLNSFTDVLHERKDFLSDAKTFMSVRGDIDILVIMLLYISNDLAKRFLLVYTPNKTLRKKVKSFLDNHSNDIELSEESHDSLVNREEYSYYKIGSKISRKVILPLFKLF